MDANYTNTKEGEGLNEDQLREIGWKMCSACKQMRPPDEFYKSAKRNGLSYTCRKCHRIKVRSYRNVEGSYNYFYRRMEKQRTKARKRGLEYTLTTADYEHLKEQDECYYCRGEMEVVTIDRMDNNKGYIPENAVATCFTCNKIKNVYPFNLDEMRLIGKAVKTMTERTKKLAEDDAVNAPIDDTIVESSD